MDFTVVDKNKNSNVTITEREYRDGVVLADVEVKFGEAQVPELISIKWDTFCADAYTTWGAGIDTQRELAPSWRKNVTKSRLASGAPLHQIISFKGNNRLTVALSDAQTPTEIATGVWEKDAYVNCEVRLFTQPVNKLTEYKVTIYIDTNDCRYSDALKAAEKFWSDECGYPCAYVPDVARRPLYSCWYSFHQDIDVEAILTQCRIGKELGMESVIVDDGWQTDDTNRGYSFCGDWELATSKIPDMKEFADKVHETGMKFIIWYSVPYVGKASKIHKYFAEKKMFLGYPRNVDDTHGFACLDPRFPEVREYLVKIYTDAARDWGLDGFKLDFIDSFRLFPDTPAYDERWDTLSLEDGVDKLLDEIITSVKKINPEILIEFRQTYFGPTIRKYGNMMRVFDCPADSFRNHINGTDLRYCMGKTPVHSDMLMWNNEDSVESAAHQVICTLFTVPQISVLLDKIPESHKKMLAFYLGFWNKNRDVLLDGDFTADNPESLYSLVKSEKDGHIIAVAHAKPVLEVDSFEKLSFVNASGGEYLIVKANADLGEKLYRTYNCTGDLVAEGKVTMEKGLISLDVPTCGMVEIF